MMEIVILIVLILVIVMAIAFNSDGTISNIIFFLALILMVVIIFKAGSYQINTSRIENKKVFTDMIKHNKYTEYLVIVSGIKKSKDEFIIEVKSYDFYNSQYTYCDIVCNEQNKINIDDYKIEDKLRVLAIIYKGNIDIKKIEKINDILR